MLTLALSWISVFSVNFVW